MGVPKCVLDAGIELETGFDRLRELLGADGVQYQFRHQHSLKIANFQVHRQTETDGIRLEICSFFGLMRRGGIKAMGRLQRKLRFYDILALLCLLSVPFSASADGPFIPGGRANYRYFYPMPSGTVPDGFGINVCISDASPNTISQISQCGFTWVKILVEPSLIIEKDGTLNFSRYDALLQQLDNHNMRAVFVFNEPPPNFKDTINLAKKSMAFISQTVLHYRDRGIVWSFEPARSSTSISDRLKTNDYISWALNCGNCIHKIAPEEWLMAMGQSSQSPFMLDSCLKAGFLNTFDAISFQPTTLSPASSSMLQIKDLRELIDKNKPTGKYIYLISDAGSSLSNPSTFNVTAHSLIASYLTDLASGSYCTFGYTWHSKPSANDAQIVKPSQYVNEPNPKTLQDYVQLLNGYRAVTLVGKLNSDGGRMVYTELFKKYKLPDNEVLNKSNSLFMVWIDGTTSQQITEFGTPHIMVTPKPQAAPINIQRFLEEF